MKKVLIVLFVCIHFLFCKSSEDCVDGFKLKRYYDVPGPDRISFKVKLSNVNRNKIDDQLFSHVVFYVNDEKLFVTHDVNINIDKNYVYFTINTTYFNYKKNFTEKDFYYLIDTAKSLKIELIYDHTNEKFTFLKCQ